MVDRQFSRAGLGTAIAAGVLVPLKDVPPTEYDGTLTLSLITRKPDDFWDNQPESGRMNDGVGELSFGLGGISPGQDIMFLIGLRIDDDGAALHDEGECVGGRRHLDRMPVTVQSENRSRQDVSYLSHYVIFQPGHFTIPRSRCQAFLQPSLLSSFQPSYIPINFLVYLPLLAFQPLSEGDLTCT